MRLFPWILYLILLFSVNSCDIFETRDAEKPIQPKSNFRQPVEPIDVITNLTNAFSDKDAENYAACFSDSNFTGRTFTFSPSAGAASQFIIFSEGWSVINEREYFNNIRTKVAETSQMSLTFSNENLNQLGDSSIYTASYTLIIPHNDSSIPKNYNGDLRFSMVRDSRSVWSIYSWVDIKKDDNPSWSELKGRFY